MVEVVEVVEVGEIEETEVTADVEECVEASDSCKKGEKNADAPLAFASCPVSAGAILSLKVSKRSVVL